MWTLPRHLTSLVILSAVVLLTGGVSLALEDIPGKEASIYSPIIQVIPDHNGKGFIRVSTSGGVMWVEASEAAKPHLTKLPVGSLIDLTIVFRGKPNPPVIKSWKLASGKSTCKEFDGKVCKNASKKSE